MEERVMNDGAKGTLTTLELLQASADLYNEPKSRGKHRGREAGKGSGRCMMC
jgi:hypothetical protein